ncbi:hypothetical protein PF002_g19076 [Phytophthora fragariae]|uniref:Secreted protein n=2 Tax=Phytophthora TaxID=4783 RepID=A0A6A3XYF8_9STRA|nr:hypothetical protein PR002_g15274 [Phytophthora rubi]KAE9209550.1 hypothetical protein PF002_g19076 [Phytophthora fragariae]KAE9295600.1 hypothetical protein PF001_g17253 [Phytophthora fragariae]
MVFATTIIVLRAACSACVGHIYTTHDVGACMYCSRKLTAGSSMPRCTRGGMAVIQAGQGDRRER